MTWKLRFTPEAADDIDRLYAFLLEQCEGDFSIAERALEAIRQGFALLEYSPLSCRKAQHGSPFLRELLIPFGASGYVALYEITDECTVTLLAVRHQREADYH